MSIDEPYGIARTQSYETFYRDFEWKVPERFNYAGDVVDAWADGDDPLALIWEDATGQKETYRFSDISRLSKQLAGALSAAGVGKGDRVILMLPRIPAWQIATIACVRLGAVGIPCIEMLTPRDIAYRVRDAGAKAAICRAPHAHKFAEVAAEPAGNLTVRVAIGGDQAGLSTDGWLDYDAVMDSAVPFEGVAEVEAEDPAMMYYTSGSTGSPKGVLHCARGLYSWRVSAIYWLDLVPGDRIWCTADTGWSKAGTAILFGPWSCGATALFYDGPFDPAERLRLLSEHKVNVYCAPATELYRVVNEDVASYDLSALRQTVSAGEAMNPVVADAWEKASGSRVSEGYGQTETLMTILNYPGEPVKYGAMGRPGPGTVAAVIDEQGRKLPPGEEGQVAIAMPNPQMMLGYWNQPEKTAASYLDGPDGHWFLTGDRGRIDEDGYFWYAGRNDDVINSAGYRIGPLEVENALMEHSAVQECAVIGTPHAERGEIVKAFIVLKDGQSGDDALAKDIQDHVKRITAPYKYPRAIAFVPELPKTATGKIRRAALRAQELERQGS